MSNNRLIYLQNKYVKNDRSDRNRKRSDKSDRRTDSNNRITLRSKQTQPSFEGRVYKI